MAGPVGSCGHPGADCLVLEGVWMRVSCDRRISGISVGGDGGASGLAAGSLLWGRYHRLQCTADGPKPAPKGPTVRRTVGEVVLGSVDRRSGLSQRW